jgi:hypothetical protein
MLTSAIIERFNLQVDDATTLSSTEELALAQEVYNEVCADRPWEFLKKTATGTMSTSVSYIALPSDFKMFSPNLDERSVIFVGTDYDEYIVVAFSDRREYRNMDGYVYLDMVNRRLYFTKQPTVAKTIEYDYIKLPATLTLSTAPEVTTDSFGNLIAYGMARRFPNMEQAEKGTSYANENEREYDRILTNLQLEDAHLKLGY